MSDLALSQSAEMFTIRVHNYQDDPTHDAISLHGLFTDRAEAEHIAHAVSIAWDFITADVHPIRLSTIEQIAAAQKISHIDPDLPADFYDAGPSGGTATAEATDQATGETQPATPAEESLRQEFLDLSAEIGAAKDRRCTYVYPGEEFLGACGLNDYVHGPEYNHPFQDDLTERFAAHVARHEAFKAQWEALAQVVHEADWTMAGPRWPWHQATAQQRQDALAIAQAVLADPAMGDDALEALVARLWTLKPKHGAPRRVKAKASKIREWLIGEGLRDNIDRPLGRS